MNLPDSKKYFHLILLSGIILISLYACSDPETEKYVSEIEKYREEVNEYMQTNPSSPFNKKGKVDFHNLKFFDVDPEFKFSSRLYKYDNPDTVKVFGTKGEERSYVRYGYLIFNYDDEDINLNVYEGGTGSGEKYYLIWFTDRTTNEESYGVGRYLNFEKEEDPEHIYEVDFNLAYNPYCAYSKDYSCAIPTKEDYLDVEITAGEKKFHD